MNFCGPPHTLKFVILHIYEKRLDIPVNNRLLLAVHKFIDFNF